MVCAMIIQHNKHNVHEQKFNIQTMDVDSSVHA